MSRVTHHSCPNKNDREERWCPRASAAQARRSAARAGADQPSHRRLGPRLGADEPALPARPMLVGTSADELHLGAVRSSLIQRRTKMATRDGRKDQNTATDES